MQLRMGVKQTPVSNRELAKIILAGLNVDLAAPSPFYVHVLYVDVEKKPGEVSSLYKFSSIKDFHTII